MKTQSKDWSSQKNMADYIDQQGYTDILTLFNDHQKYLHSLIIVSHANASRRVVEVGWARFFGFAGYISPQRCTRMNVRTYEQLAMLSINIQKIYIYPHWFVREYLRRYKAGAQKKGNGNETLKCWNGENH